ncbi:MAG: chemotaxis protein CheX, partial [Planctomycetota bacterium]
NSPFDSLTRDAVGEAVRDLVPQARADVDASGALTAVAVIGFAGDEVRGTLGLAASRPGLARVAREAGVDPDDPLAAHDSLGELANFVVGHVKRCWARRGVHATLSTPLTLRGVAIEVCGAERCANGTGAFVMALSNAEETGIHVWLDYHCPREVVLLEDDSIEQVADQGDALFF